jgi:hypothetical protein
MCHTIVMIDVRRDSPGDSSGWCFALRDWHIWATYDISDQAFRITISSFIGNAFLAFRPSACIYGRWICTVRRIRVSRRSAQS